MSWPYRTPVVEHPDGHPVPLDSWPVVGMRRNSAERRRVRAYQQDVRLPRVSVSAATSYDNWFLQANNWLTPDGQTKLIQSRWRKAVPKAQSVTPIVSIGSGPPSVSPAIARRNATNCPVALVLAAVTQHARSPRAEKLESPEIVQDRGPPRAMRLDVLLLQPWRRLRPVDDRGDRFSCKCKRDCESLREGELIAAGWDAEKNVGRQRSHEPAGEVDEVTTLTNHASPTLFGVVQPVLARQATRCHAIQQLHRVTLARDVLPHRQGQRSEATIETDLEHAAGRGQRRRSRSSGVNAGGFSTNTAFPCSSARTA